MKKPTLVVMAAGMGSRFGGLKQMTPIEDVYKRQLYVLCTQNRLYSIDPLMGTLEMVGTIPMSAGLSFMTLACATDGTFYAATYSDYNSRLYKFVLTDEGFTVTPFPKTTGMKVAFLQSMTYDHNTGKLYHANYGAKTYYTTFISYDLTTGEATVLDELYQAELCGLFIPVSYTHLRCR